MDGRTSVEVEIISTRKYVLCGYILGVLTHTTTWDRLLGGDETLKSVSINVALLSHA